MEFQNYAYKKETQMNRVIYKYPLEIADRQGIRLPVGYEILKIEFQGETLNLWVSVPQNHDQRETLFLRVVPTGREYEPTGLTFLTTVQQYQGHLIWHIFKED